MRLWLMVNFMIGIRLVRTLLVMQRFLDNLYGMIFLSISRSSLDGRSIVWSLVMIRFCVLFRFFIVRGRRTIVWFGLLINRLSIHGLFIHRFGNRLWFGKIKVLEDWIWVWSIVDRTLVGYYVVVNRVRRIILNE